jgi:MFS family permease
MESVKESNVSKPDFYYIYIIIFTIIFLIIQSITILFHKHETYKNLEEEKSIDTSLLSRLSSISMEHISKESVLRENYLQAFLTAKGAMWAKAPYTFLLFNVFHKFTVPQIGILYLVDAVFSLLTGPFLGLIADTFGRKIVSFFYPFNMIIILILRMSGNIPMAYLAQIISGCSSGILATSFEAWLNFEITKLFDESENKMDLMALKYMENFKKSIFSDVVYYDSILSIVITILGAIIFTKFGIFASLSMACLIALISCFIILIRWTENKPNEESSEHPFISMWEGIKLLVHPQILSVGILDSMHMSGINIFNFIWTPILQITAGTINIHPGMIFITMLISFLVQNKILQMINSIYPISYYYLCSIFNLSFLFSFMGIYIFNTWNARLICLMIIGVKK